MFIIGTHYCDSWFQFDNLCMAEMDMHLSGMKTVRLTGSTVDGRIVLYV